MCSMLAPAEVARSMCGETRSLRISRQDSGSLLSAANRELDRKGLQALTKKVRGREMKDTRAYEAASRPFADRRRLLEVRTRDPSLALFIFQLDALPASPAEPS